MSDYRIQLHAEPGDVPAIIRIRAALKTLQRRFGLRCVEISEVNAEAPTPARDETSSGKKETVTGG